MADAEKSDEPSSANPVPVPEATTDPKPAEAKTSEGTSAAEVKKDGSPEEGKGTLSEDKDGQQPKRGNSKEIENKDGDLPKRRSSEETQNNDGEQPKRRSSKEIENKDGELPKRRSSKEAEKRKSIKLDSKGGGGGDDLDDEDEEKEEEPKIIYPIDEKIQQTLRTAWTLFVKKNQKKKTEISEADVPTVMRSIGINPTEVQIQTLIAYAKTQDLPTCSKGFLTYENFEQRVAESLQLQPTLWIRKTKDEILAALHTLCEYKDQIEAETFKKLMMTKGDVLTDPEGNAMLHLAKDRDTAMIYLDEYADILSKDAIRQPPPDPTIW